MARTQNKNIRKKTKATRGVNYNVEVSPGANENSEGIPVNYLKSVKTLVTKSRLVFVFNLIG